MNILREKTIVIDAGHGGRDSGATFRDIREKDIALATAQRLAESLKLLTPHVYLTRNRDETILISHRDKLARRVNADLYISVHYNAGGNENTNGGEVWLNKHLYGQYRFTQLAAAYRELGLHWRGAKNASKWHGRVLYIDRKGYYIATIPALLWEVDFVQSVWQQRWWKDGKLTDEGYSDIGYLIGRMVVEINMLAEGGLI